MGRSRTILGVSIAVLAIVTLLIWYTALAADRGGNLFVHFFDVGQGDAVFIESPSGRQVLIDGGAGRAVLRELAKRMPFFDRSLDIIIATHPDTDHIGGLVDVLARYGVETIVRSSVVGESDTVTAFDEAVAREGASLVDARRGQRIELGEGAYIEILFPDRNVRSVETNTGSIVARLVYGATSFMLTGDAPAGVENYLVRLDADSLRSDVLKAGHHGSKTSSAPLFVGFVSPRYAIFSRGCNNRYGHPHPGIVATFKKFEVPALDTCEEGTISFVSDGQTVGIR